MGTSMKHKTVLYLITIVSVWAVLCSNSTAATVQSSRSNRFYLTSTDFSQLKGNTGQWEVVGDVFLNPKDDKLLSSTPGEGTLLNGPKGNTSHLLSKMQLGDVRAHIEFMVPKGSNSGVYFQGRYEIQVFDSWGKQSEYPGIECGGIYQRWDESKNPKGFEGHSPQVNASRPPGQWQTFDVVFRAPRFDKAGKKLSNARFEKVVHNGVIVHEDLELYGPTRASAYNDEKPSGPLMFQGDHGPVAYRNVWVEPAGPLPFFAMDTALRDGKHETPEKRAAVLDELGYSGFGTTGVNGLEDLLVELDKKGLRLYNTYVGVNIDAEQKYDPNLKDAVKTFKGRNTILWLYVLGKKNKATSEDDDARAAKIIQEIAEMAEEKGVRVALYPHTGFFVETVEDAVRIAEKVNKRNVGVTFNLCHWLMVGSELDTRSLIEMAMPHLFLVTINGSDKAGKDWKKLIQPLDQGTFDISGFLITLSECGYNGPIGFQGYGIGGDAYDNLKRTMGAWLKYSKHMNK